MLNNILVQWKMLIFDRKFDIGTYELENLITTKIYEAYKENLKLTIAFNCFFSKCIQSANQI